MAEHLILTETAKIHRRSDLYGLNFYVQTGEAGDQIESFGRLEETTASLPEAPFTRPCVRVYLYDLSRQPIVDHDNHQITTPGVPEAAISTAIESLRSLRIAT